MKLREVLTEDEARWLRATFLPYQIAWILDDATIAVAVKARQIGFTDATLGRAALLARRGRTQVVLTCNELLALEAIRKAASITRWLYQFDGGCFFVDHDATELRWMDGGRIIAIEANPRTARSFSGDLYLDEMDFMRDQEGVAAAAFPIASRGDHTIRVCSTPNPPNLPIHPTLFRQFVIRSYGAESGSSLHRVTLDDAISQGLEVDREKCRKLVGGNERLWRISYECSFEDGVQS